MKTRLLICAATSLFASVSAAFTLISPTDPNMQGWSRSTLQFRLNPANCPDNIHGLIDEAMSVWNGVATSSLHVEVSGTSSATAADLVGGTADPSETPVIVCDPNFAATTGANANLIPGVGGSTNRGPGSSLFYGYLLLNVQAGASGNIETMDATRAAVVIAHEIGHVIGLGHTPDSSALMYYNASAKTELALSQDDVDGITYLYPRNEPFADPLMGGCGLVRASGGAGAGGGSLGGGDGGSGGSGSKDFPFAVLLWTFLPLLVWLRLRCNPKTV